MSGSLEASVLLAAGLHSISRTTITAAFHVSNPIIPSKYRTSMTTTQLSSVSNFEDSNTMPSLCALVDSINALKCGFEIRGSFTDHKRLGTILKVADTVEEKVAERSGTPLTPLSAYCYGHAFARVVIKTSSNSKNLHIDGAIDNVGSVGEILNESQKDMNLGSSGCLDISDKSDVSGKGMEEYLEPTTICVGRDPRVHGMILADAMCRGIESVKGVKAVCTGLASTPAMFELCRYDAV